LLYQSTAHPSAQRLAHQPDFNLGQLAGRVSWFFLVSSGKFRDSISKETTLILFHVYSILYSLIAV
jgi:hypothetical protein